MMGADVWTVNWIATATVLVVVITLWIVLDRTCAR